MDAVIAEIQGLRDGPPKSGQKYNPRLKVLLYSNCEWLLQNKKLNTTDFDLLGQFN